MKTDPHMIQAAHKLAKLAHRPDVSPETRAVARFTQSILIPLMTARSNSNAHKTARGNLIARGRNAAELIAHNDNKPTA